MAVIDNVDKVFADQQRLLDHLTLVFEQFVADAPTSDYQKGYRAAYHDLAEIVLFNKDKTHGNVSS
jgi:hypothetical protein